MVTIKVYSTKCTQYSTIGRKNARIEAKSRLSGEMTPKYGKALVSNNAKKEIKKVFN